MKYLFLVLQSAILLSPLFAEEESSDSPVIYFELGEISAPLSFYTEDWDPKQKLLPILPEGQKVEEKDLIVDLDDAVKESRKEQDLLRNQNSWLYEARSWPIYTWSQEEYHEKIESEEALE